MAKHAEKNLEIIDIDWSDKTTDAGDHAN